MMNSVIAIAGPPGSGKSTLVTELTGSLGQACSIFCDDYQTITDKPIEDVAEWISSGGSYDEFNIPGLADDLQKLRNNESIVHPVNQLEITPSPYIFFETHFGRLHNDSARFIDLLVWLDVPLDLALARKIKTFVGMFLLETESRQPADNLRWLDHYLNDYITQVRNLLEIQRKEIMADADIIVDGRGDVESAVAQVLEALQKYGK